MSGTKSNLRSALMLWSAVAVLGGLGFVAFLSFGVGARLDVATAGLVAGGAALVFSLATLFRMVQVLSRPRAALGLSSRALGGVSRSQLREEKRRLIRAIKELKFDFQMGKLSEPDFVDVKQTYELRAVEVMRELDGVKRVHPEVYALLEDRGLTGVLPEGAVKPVKKDASEQTSAAEEGGAASSEAASSEAASSAWTDAAEPGQAADSEDSASTAEEAPSQACGACSGANDPDAKFCKHCGKEISA